MLKSLLVLLFSFAPVALTFGQEVKNTQWDATQKSLSDLVSEGYEIKSTTNNLPSAVMSSVMIVITHYLQNGKSAARCTEAYRNNLPAREGTGQPYSLFGCSLLVKPHPIPQ